MRKRIDPLKFLSFSVSFKAEEKISPAWGDGWVIKVLTMQA